MVNKKKLLVAASIAGLMASSSVAMAGAAFPGHDSMKKMQCDMNGCKGNASCKGSHHACKSGNGCSSKGADTSAKVENGQLTGK